MRAVARWQAKGRRKEYRAKLHGRAQFDIYRVCDSDIVRDSAAALSASDIR